MSDERWSDEAVERLLDWVPDTRRGKAEHKIHAELLAAFAAGSAPWIEAVSVGLGMEPAANGMKTPEALRETLRDMLGAYERGRAAGASDLHGFVPRCKISGHPCGTDTRVPGGQWCCEPCHVWAAGFTAGASEATPAAVDVYNRPECIFNYCPQAETCRAQDRCQHARP